MEFDRFSLIVEAFDRAVRAAPGDGQRVIDELARGEFEIREEVLELLATDASSRNRFDSVAESFGRAAARLREQLAQPPCPQRIGSYRILGLVGEGGMGIVYRGEHAETQRAAALKVVRRHLRSRHLLERFEREELALARLHHRGIAELYETGTVATNDGPLPYFAMEFVDGTPLKLHADGRELGTQERLALVAKICDAAEYTHRHGVIHRDLKPDNVLVTDRGEPKLLDFGVARLIDDGDRASRRSGARQLIGTLPYMSPEQAAVRSGPLDRRTDIYSLGVIAYELIAGRLPFDLRRKHIREALRTIREAEPAPLETVCPGCHGSIATIVHKAMAKDPERRHASAGALADEIRQQLRGGSIAVDG